MKINVISWIECYGWTADRNGTGAHLGRGRISKAMLHRSVYGPIEGRRPRIFDHSRGESLWL